MTSPKVSVIVPFYNEEKYIFRCVRSVLRQNFSDFELIMVDDGSDDNSVAIVKKIAVDDDRVKLVGHGRVGLVKALNCGVEVARGELIARMDADDIMHRERLGVQYEFMSANHDVSVLSCLVRAFPQRAISPNMLEYINWLNALTADDAIKRDIFIESPIPHPSVMLRHAELLALGGYRDNGMPEDYDLWLRYFVAHKKFHKIPRLLHFWRERSERLSRVSEVYSQENFVKLKAGHLAEHLLSERENIYIWGAGRDGKRLFRYLGGRSLDIRGFIDVDQKKISQRIYRLPVIDYNELPGMSCFIVVCVGTKGIRSKIRDKLGEFGYIEGDDYVCLA